jgi:hypothetical protein
MTYKPRGAPKRLKYPSGVLDIFKHKSPCPLDYDVTWTATNDGMVVGLDFGESGVRGQHFFLKPHEYQGYRKRMNRQRVSWDSLPVPLQRSIICYFGEG